MRLIDADALEEFLLNDSSCLTVFEAIRKTQAMPTIDAVPVVRCQECQYSRKPNRAFRDEAVACEGVLVCYVGFDHVHPTSDDGMIFVNEDGFCSEGQRREDGDNGTR